MIYCVLGELLEISHLSRKEFATRTGIGLNSINRYCNNTWLKFDKDHMKIICEYFGCEIGTLLRYFSIEEGVDENLMKNAIRYKLLQDEYSKFLDSLSDESKKKLGIE